MAVTAEPHEFDAIVVGAGFSGMYMLIKLRELGLTARVIEAGTNVGGTWYWNRYPGARVDTQSLEYSFSFSADLEREWRWSERYAPQAELLAYAEHVAERFDLRRDIVFETRVNAAHFDAASNRWTVTTDRGETLRARYCIMATGCLSVPTEVTFPGIESYTGALYRTSRWPRDGVDLTGKRVGFVGTGSSGIQAIPVIAEQAAQLTVFQRTPNYSMPAHNGPIPDEDLDAWQANREDYRARSRGTALGFLYDPREQLALDATPEERDAEYERRWQVGGFRIFGAFADIGADLAANATVADFAKRKIRSIVHDPAVADLLTPKDHPFASKRLCVDTNYYATYNRPNVRLVDLRSSPIEAITPNGIRTSAESFDFDAIVLATGFDALTGAIDRIDIRGRDGVRMKDRWADGPRTYLGLMVAGFPNLFIITGPGSPSVLSNMMTSIEQHVEWITDCLSWLAGRQQAVIEASPEAEEQWVAHVDEVSKTTLYPHANSWYMGANVPGKPRRFLPYAAGVDVYRAHCADIAAKGYEGFVIGAAA